MSNYLLAVTNARRTDKVRTWVEENSSGPSEYRLVALSNGHYLHYIALNAELDVDEDSGILFKGFAVDYDYKSIIFGAGGMRDFAATYPEAPAGRAIEGCHIAALWTANEMTVTNDLFSMCSMYYTAEFDFVAVSDSTYMISALRRLFGYDNSINSEAAIARAWGNSMGGQLMSPDTLVDAIKYAPVGTSLTISYQRMLSLTVVRRDVHDVFAHQAQSYKDGLRSTTQRMASLLHTLSGVSMNAVRLSLSGGMDSRVCMAAALLSPTARSQAAFNCTNTNASHAADYAVVSEMAAKFGFPLGLRDAAAQSPARTTRRFKESLGLWYLANAGVYDFLVLPNYVLNSVGAFNFSGHGAELHKGNYGWRPVRAIADNIKNPVLSDAFRFQSEKALSGLGVDVDSSIGSEWHYLAYRNALHGGQVSTTSMVGHRPLMMRDLVALNRSSQNPYPRPSKSGPSMVNDVLIMLSPAAAAFRFDDSKKDMTPEHVEDRERALGGSLSEEEVETYLVLGDYRAVASGFPRFFKDVVTAEGYWQEPSRGSLANLAIEGYEKIGDPNVKEAYLPVLKEAIAKLMDPSLAYQQMGGSIGKLLGMHLAS